MNALRLVLLAVPMAFGAFASVYHQPTGTTAALREPQDEVPSKSIVVYVSDFDLDVAARKEEKSPAPGSTATAPAAGQKKKETAFQQALRLNDSLGASLVKALEDAGYTAHRLRGWQPRPEKGVRIQGVFAQVDEEGRLRRARIGSESAPATLQLFVGVSNLARPDQKLYEIAGAIGGDNTFGPVITVSAYAPVAKFEMGKDPNEQELKELSAKMVTDLTALLKANPIAISQ
jgi:Domain of unknown function (DUF4410)